MENDLLDRVNNIRSYMAISMAMEHEAQKGE